MADQKSRGGQKQGFEGQEGKEHRPTHAEEGNSLKNERSMKEDARRGQQGNDGGYNESENAKNTAAEAGE